MAHKVTLIPGDGIGPEVAAATRLVLDAAHGDIEWVDAVAGAGALESHGALLPEATLDAIRDCRVALKGPITTPVGTGFRSVNVALRQELDLFAAVRPARALPGVPIRHPDTNLVVVRENTEDLYQGIEFERGSPEAAALREKLRELAGFEVREDAGITLKPISVAGTRRIVRFAFEYARANRRRKVTLGHKSNVMRYSDGLFLKTFLDIARDPMIRGDIEVEEIQIDHLSMRLAWEPEAFDVLLLPNLYGDILSDLCAGLVGGLGLIPGANIGWEYAVFEPVHGSAPGHRREGPGEPDRDDPVRRDDAPPPGGARRRGACGARRRHRARARASSERPTSAGRRARRRSARPSSERSPASRSVRVVVMAFGTSTEVLGEASTARLAVMPAALLPGERGVQPVAERQAELRQERRVVRAPVREEVPAVLLDHRPEPVVAHAPMLRRPNSTTMCFTRSAQDARLGRCSPS